MATDKENHGIVRSASPFKTAGFWTFDPTTTSLTNEMSGQRVRLCGPVEDEGQDTPPEGTVWRFEYEDRNIRYPLIVSVGAFPWRLDHLQSATLWRDGGEGRAIPPYGLWHRIDECAIDALLCWPEIEVTGPVPSNVISSGGWFNGEWSQQIQRSRDSGGEFAFDDDAVVTPPFLEPFDTPASSWRFVPAPHVAGSATLTNVQEIAADRLYLPADQELIGFEQDMPHMRRSDGRAVTFPAGLDSWLWRGEDYDPAPVFLYADEDAFFCFPGEASETAPIPGWPPRRRTLWRFRLSFLTRVGLRHLDQFDTSESGPLPARLFVQKRIPPPLSYKVHPSPALLQKLRIALQDAWLTWAGCSERLLDSPAKLVELTRKGIYPAPALARSGIDLNKKSHVEVKGAYVGGRFNWNSCSTAWLENTASSAANPRLDPRIAPV